VGAAIATALGGAGCDVLVTYRQSEQAARDTCAALASASGVCAGALLLDLDNPATAASKIGRVARSLPRVDVLVHNAAAYESTPFGDITQEQALGMWRTNALSPLLLSQELAPLLCASPLPCGGAIVCMVDMHALGQPRKRFSPYLMSKAALHAMAQALALELAPEVRVNAVAPGVVAFPEVGEEADPDMQQRYLSHVPLARSGSLEEAARAVRFLALEATYTTGEVLRVDGGRFLR